MILSFFFLLLQETGADAQPMLYGQINPGIAWGTYNHDERDVLSCLANDASLARISEPSGGITVQRPFMIPELLQYQLAVAFPVGKGVSAVHLSGSGAPAFQVLMPAISFARSLGKRIDIGVQFNYTHVKAPGYRIPPVPGIGVGAVMHLTQRLNGGWNLRIPMKKPVGGSSWDLGYSMGLGYDASEEWSAAAELEKAPGQPVNARIGFIYKIHPSFWLKAGITTSGPPAWFACCFGLRFFRLGLSASIHEQLGVSTAISITKQFSKTR